MGLRRARFVVAQLGLKAGKREVLATLLGCDDLPGGPWQVLDERTWRTGVTGPSTPWRQRARQTGSITAWRSFGHAAGSRRTWVQVTPLASAEDARNALDGIGELALRNLNAEVRLVSERDVAMEPFAGASAIWAREQHTESRHGPGVALMMAAAARRWLMVIALSGSPAWDWRAASEIAAVQAGRLPA